MAQQLKVEIKGKDEFWDRAFHVEWEHQFPDRKLTSDSMGTFLVQGEWLDDLETVATQTFCKVVPAPENALRRQWMNSLIARLGGS